MTPIEWLSVFMNVAGVLTCAVLGLQLLRAAFPTLDVELFYHGTRLRALAIYHADRLFLRRLSVLLNRGAVPPRSTDKTVSCAWLTRVLRNSGYLQPSARVASATLDKKGLDRGFVGAMSRVTLTYEPAQGAAVEGKVLPKTVVFKMTPATSRTLFQSVLLRSAREAIFYAKKREEAWLRHVNTPLVYYAKGSFTTGWYVILMEDLSGEAQSVQVMGNQCWGAPPPQPAGAPTPVELLEAAFTSAADMHARYWCDEALLEQSFLKGSDLWRGKGRARYEAGHIAVAHAWRVGQAATLEGGVLHKKVVLPPKLVAVMDTSIKVTSWQALCAEYNPKSLPFTLCHGDFHAANSMWRMTKLSEAERAGREMGLVLVDWSEVGIGHGATPLSQFLISNATIELRRQQEKRLVKLYWDRLVASGVDGKAYTFEMCWDRYVRGGIERWLQMLAFMVSFAVRGNLPPDAAQWFVNQVAAFVDDHAAEGTAYPFASSYCLPRQ